MTNKKSGKIHADGRSMSFDIKHRNQRIKPNQKGAVEMKKRLLAFALCVVMVIAMAVPAFALPNGIVTPGEISQDTAHGHYFSYGPYVLNQWG